MTKQRIIFLSPYDPRDIRKWSGTIHSLYQALVSGAAAASFRADYISGGVLDSCARLVNRGCRLWRKIDCRFSTAYAVVAGLVLTIRFALSGDATIIAVATSNYLPYLITRKKIIYVSDATFSAISDLYPSFRAYPDWLKRQGERNERLSLRKARFVIYPSQWASDSAKMHYGVSAEKIVQLPFGPNIQSDLIERTFTSKPSIDNDAVNIMFVSTDWKRKNGDLVVDVCEQLRNRGLNVRLVIIGETPAHIAQLPFVDARGWFDKAEGSKLEQLCLTYAEATLLLLPTKAEAFGVVYSEAQAFGVPSISCDVGGVGSAIIDGQTGSLLPIDAKADAFAAEVEKYVRDPALYDRVSRACRERYLTQANWAAWARVVFSLAAISEEGENSLDVSSSLANMPTQARGRSKDSFGTFERSRAKPGITPTL